MSSRAGFFGIAQAHMRLVTDRTRRTCEQNLNWSYQATERMAKQVQWNCILGKLEAVGDEISKALGLSTIIEVSSGQRELEPLVPSRKSG